MRPPVESTRPTRSLPDLLAKLGLSTALLISTLAWSPGCKRRPALPNGLAIEWEAPVVIYDSTTKIVYVPSGGLPPRYEVTDYWVAGQVVYGTIDGRLADPTIYFIIQPSAIASFQGTFIATEHRSRPRWIDALRHLDISHE